MTKVETRAEEAVIASLLLDPGLVPLVGASLNPDDFRSRLLGDALREMMEMTREGRRIDILTLANRGVDLANELDVLGAARGDALDEYITIIADAAFRRRVVGHLDTIRLSAEGRESRESILGSLAKFQQQVALEAAGDDIYSHEKATQEYARILEQRKTQGVGLPYGIPALDRFVQPAHGGDMVVVAARPSVGKTALAEHIADSWAWESDLPVVFISIEMSLGQLMDRAVSRSGGIPSSNIVRGIMTPEEEARAQVTLEERKSVNLWYVDNPYSTTDTVRAAAAEVALAAGGIRGFVIDYLQLLKDAGDQETQRITRVSRNVKALAREYNAPVLALSQLNRQSEYRDDKHPKLADIRESGAIEQDADVVLGLYRDRENHDDYMDIDILKNRQGPSNMRVTVPFDGDTVSFEVEE
jgi:replicative DNA helicase